MNAIISEDKGKNDVDVDQNQKLFSNFIEFNTDFWTFSNFIAINGYFDDDDQEVLIEGNALMCQKISNLVGHPYS